MAQKPQESEVSLIAALGRNRAIGKDGDLLWKIPDDLKRFRDITRGHPVIMGRKTWESLPERARPLPGRANVVVSRDAAYAAAGATVCTSLEDALAAARASEGADEIFVIGGGQLYTEALPRAGRLYLTLIDAEKEGDSFFPDYSAFTRTIEKEERDYEGIAYTWLTLEKD